MKRTVHSLGSLALAFILLGGGLSACSGNGLALASSNATPVPVATVTADVTAEGHVAPRDSAQLAFLIAGDVSDVLVKEGDRVTKDTVLVRLSNREQMEANVTAASLALLSAQQTLDTLNDNGDVTRSAAQLALTKAQKVRDDAKKTLDNKQYQRASQQTIDIARANLIVANKALEDAESIYNHNKTRNSDDVVFAAALSQLAAAQQRQINAQYNFDYVSDLPDPLDVETAQAALEVAQANLNAAKREWDKVKDTGFNADQIALAQSTKDNAQAGLAAAQAALDNLEIKAPYDGTVVDVNVAAKEHVTPSQPVVQIADLSEWFVDTSDLTEMDVVRLTVGQTVTVVPDSLPTLQLKGHIDSISDGYSEKAGDILYKVRIRLDQVDPRLRWGMTVNATFTKP